MTKILRKILIICLIVIMNVAPLQAFADNSEVNTDDEAISSGNDHIYNKTYAMVFDTGNMPGACVEFFLIKYTDKNGHTGYTRIDPELSAAAYNEDLALAYGEEVARIKARLDAIQDEFMEITKTYRNNPELLRMNMIALTNEEKALRQKYEAKNSMLQNLENGGSLMVGTYGDELELSDNAKKMIELGKEIMPDDPGFTGNNNNKKMTKSDNLYLLLDEDSKKNLGYAQDDGGFKYGTKAAPFAANSKTTVFFNYDFNPATHTIEDIEVYMNSYKQDRIRLDSWSLKSWDIYELSDNVSDLRYSMLSNVSEEMIIQFGGKKVMSAVNVDGELAIESQYNEQYVATGDANLIKFPIRGEGTITKQDGYLKEDIGPLDNKTFPGMVRFKNSPEAQTYSESDYYTAVLSIPDANKTGLESLDKLITEDKLDLKEALIADIEYVDGADKKQSTKVPVITNAMLKLADEDTADENGSSFTDAITSGEALTVAQQGNKIAFDFLLPNCREIKSMSIKYNNIENESKEELFGINAVKIYKKSSATVKYTSKNFVDCTVEASEDPVASYKASNYNGTSIYCGTSETFKLTEGGSNEYPERNIKNTYLVNLRTANIPAAATKDDVKVSLGYTNTKGVQSNTQEYRMSEAALDYYGYWKGVNSKGDAVDAALQYGLRAGGEISFLVQSSDISEFTGITISLDEGGKDDWQLDGIDIIRLDTLSNRIGKTFKESNTAYNGGAPGDEQVTVNGITLDRFYYREATGDVMFTKDSMEVLVQKNQKRTYKFYDDDVNNKSGSLEDDPRNFNEYRYSMDWNTANSDLRFTETVKSYEVKVSVPTNSSQGVLDDGCGSKNLYYFQLVFDGGESAYVLANNQMTTDGFIAGSTSSFTISMNEDYGDVVGVNIIPDDLDENSDILDKLCISKIEVIKNNRNGINRSFIIDEVGWLNREYHAQDAAGVKEKRVGRSEQELVCSYTVDHSEVKLKYEISISTGVGKNKEGEEVQYEGPIKADIQYYNSKGELKIERDFDVVKAMYEYYNMEPRIENNQYVTNPEFMLRSESIDRFHISITDAVSISRIRLKCDNPSMDAVWKIKGIEIGVVTSGSVLKLNSANEYQMTYDNPNDPILLVDEITNITLPVNFSIAKDNINTKEFEFDQNTIPLIENEEAKIDIVPRVPESENDIVNIYVHLSDKAVDPSEFKYDLSAELSYSGSKLDYKNKRVLNKMTDANGNIIMYVEGMNARNFKTFKNLSVYSSLIRDGSRSNLTAPISYAVIQQIRNNTLVETYYLPFNGADPCLFTSKQGVSCMTATTGNITNEKQQVQFTLGEDTTKATLNPVVYDMAVAIEYTPKNRNGASSSTLRSPYIYLSDQEIEKIKAGDMITVEFNQPYVKDIKSVKVVATGGIKAQVEAGYVVTYDEKGNASQRYKFNSGSVVKDYIGTFAVTNESSGSGGVVPVNFAFKTMETAGSSNAGTSKPVKVEIRYETSDGTVATKRIEDLTKFTEQGMIPGEEIEASIFLDKFNSLRTIEITPTDGWGVDTVTAKINKSGEVDTRVIKVNQMIYADTPYTVNFADIVVRANAICGQTNKTADNSTIEVLAQSGDKVAVKTYVTGALQDTGYKYTIEKFDEGATSTIESRSVSRNDGTIEFIAPYNGTQMVERYKITISSNESPTIQSYVIVAVEPQSGENNKQN